MASHNNIHNKASSKEFVCWGISPYKFGSHRCEMRTAVDNLISNITTVPLIYQTNSIGCTYRLHRLCNHNS